MSSCSGPNGEAIFRKLRRARMIPLDAARRIGETEGVGATTTSSGPACTSPAKGWEGAHSSYASPGQVFLPQATGG